MSSQAPVIAVDGSSGVGKGELTRQLARRLGWHLLDSGCLYRALAHAAELRGLGANELKAVAKLAADLNVRFLETGEILLGGQEIDTLLRTERCGALASELAALPAVRAALFARQRKFRRKPGLVADGRDMGTAIFPDAALKVFLTASPQERVQRRHKQLIEKGFNVSLTALSEELAQRDARDAQRKASPLRPAKDAWVIDTTALGITAVFDLVWSRASGIPSAS